jgi:hypothetical protein
MSFTLNSSNKERKPYTNAIVRSYNDGEPINPWTYSFSVGNIPVLVPSIKKSNVNIFKDLIVDGTITANAYFTSSDFNLKSNIEDLDFSFNDKIMNLLPKQYTYKSDKEQTPHYGFIAQELEEEFPELVKEISSNNQKVKTINYPELIPILLFKIKDLQSQIDKLKKMFE